MASRAMLSASLALVSALLCVIARAQHVTTYRRCSIDLFKRIEKIQYEVKKAPADQRPPPCTLYTPPVLSALLLCPAHHLQCFAAELTVLKQEWKFTWSRVNPVNDLKKLAKQFNQSASACDQCEVNMEHDTEDFLEALMSTLKVINILFCN